MNNRQNITETNKTEYYQMMVMLKSLLRSNIIDRETADITASNLAVKFNEKYIYLW